MRLNLTKSGQFFEARSLHFINFQFLKKNCSARLKCLIIISDRPIMQEKKSRFQRHLKSQDYYRKRFTENRVFEKILVLFFALIVLCAVTQTEGTLIERATLSHYMERPRSDFSAFRGILVALFKPLLMLMRVRSVSFLPFFSFAFRQIWLKD